MQIAPERPKALGRRHPAPAAAGHVRKRATPGLQLKLVAQPGAQMAPPGLLFGGCQGKMPTPHYPDPRPERKALSRPMQDDVDSNCTQIRIAVGCYPCSAQKSQPV